MNSVLFDFGFIQIKWYSFFILVAIITAYYIIYKELKKKDIKEDEFTNIIFYGILTGILGARIYYVLFNLEYYLTSPIEIIKMWNGGLAIHGGLIASLTFLIIYTKKKSINLLLILDTIVIGLIVAQAIGRWGNFFNQEAYGRIVSKSFLESIYIPNFVIKGMYIDGAYREPTFLYESVLSIVGFIILLLLRKAKGLKTGTLTSIYLIWYGLSRLIIESFRADSLMLGTIKIAQLISIIGIISGIILLIISIKRETLYKETKVYLSK